MKVMQTLFRLWPLFFAVGLCTQLHAQARTPRSVAKPNFLSAKDLAESKAFRSRSLLNEGVGKNHDDNNGDGIEDSAHRDIRHDVKLQNQKGKTTEAHPIVKHVDVGALILEPRCHVALPLTVWNMRRQLPSLPIQLFYADSNEDCVKKWFANTRNMTLTKLGGNFWLGQHNSEDFSWIYTNADFWAQVRHKKVLSFQQDSWICNHAEAKLKKFVQYDYVGAPWPHNQVPQCPGGVGNGGFSLRDVSVMKDISNAFGQSTQPEDTYFCQNLGGWKSVNVSDTEGAAEFSAEEFDGSVNHSPLGLHKAWAFGWYNEDAQLQKNCPGVHLLAHANQIDSKYEEDHTGAVKMGDHLVQMAEKLIPQGKDFAVIDEDGDDTLLQTASSSLFAVTIRRQTQASFAILSARERWVSGTRLAIIVALATLVAIALCIVWLYLPRSTDKQHQLANTEGAPCEPQGNDRAVGVPQASLLMKGILMGLLHIVFSTAMILFNKYLMNPQRFPYAVCLTTMHNAFTLLFTRLLHFLKPSLFAGSNVPSDIKQVNGMEAVNMKHLLDFLPIGSCMALSVVTGNMAYSFSSVSFLQMLKEAVVLIVYVLSVLWGLEAFRMRNLIVLICVTACAVVAVHGEMHFVWAGLLLQLIASVGQGAQAVLTNKLMIRTGGPKLDPLTTVLRTAPVVLLVLVPFNYIFWSPWILHQFFIYKFELLLSASLAFSLQVVNAATIQQISATGLTLAGVLKDLIIVVSAVIVLNESLTVVQILGFSGAIIGIGVYSAMKIYPSWFERVVPPA